MLTMSAFAETATLVGDPGRATMLATLMDGRALTAGELARVAGITASTASEHLARLLQAGLLVVERQGRHRYYRLASPAVARMIEGIMSVAAGSVRPHAVVVGPRDRAMRRARVCYDHLAGEIAVAIADRMAAAGQIDLDADGAAVTGTGDAFLRTIGVDLDATRTRAGRRVGTAFFCRPCLDWSERRPHIAGAIGAALYQTCLTRGWLRRGEGTRALVVTPAGVLAFDRHFAIR